jgi:hypothetical protein
MLPLRLTDDLLDPVMRGAAPLFPQDRHKYLQRVAELLYQQRAVARAAARRSVPVSRRSTPRRVTS